MVDSQNIPSRDGLDQLFGDSARAQSWSLGSLDSAPAPQSRREALEALPSRRELRTSGKASKKRRGRAAAARKAPTTYTRPIDSAYPANRVIVVRQQPKSTSARKRGSGFVTALAVLGLFGSVALPAYAMAPLVVNGDSASSTLGSEALVVADNVQVAAATRAIFQATSASDLRQQRRTALISANYEAYMASGAREKGDDYPWFSELSTNQGGGLSPLNYFYRECVDFVAWRLNRDAGSFSAPFKYTWSTLTPSGGNAYQWKRAWQKNGWETSTTPIAGAVAWYSYGHVAYVKSVNSDGTITVEDYNQSGMKVYDIRVVAPNDAQLYLYPPPR